MAKSKAYQAAAAKIEADRFYTPTEAVALAKETGSAKFDSTVEVALKLAVDPRKADQMVRGTVILPHGTGKTAGGWTAFDSAVSTPELMGQVGRLGKVLGPRGLMPNPKTGTVTPNPAKAVEEIKGGKIEFRVDKHANVHFVVGKASFSAEQLDENIGAALEEIVRLKPSSAKGRYIQKGAVSTTFGPGIPLDVNAI
jgi:large subunit ribosomal protein L1